MAQETCSGAIWARSVSPAFTVGWPAVAVGPVDETVVNGSSGSKSSVIPPPLVLKSCGELVGTIVPQSAG